jgi:hypothetical protein
MSFICKCCNKLVNKENKILVPSIIRKVNYHGFHKIKNRTPIDGQEYKMVFVDTTTGFETVKEIPIAKSHYDNFMASGFQAQIIDSTKDVDFIKPRKRIKIEDKFDFNDKKDFE